jgi:hypothetical protein
MVGYGTYIAANVVNFVKKVKILLVVMWFFYKRNLKSLVCHTTCWL